jgi:Translation initiation factor IF-2, N-terminal region
MGKIRVNDLARELEVKSTILLIYLSRLGITVKATHIL